MTREKEIEAISYITHQLKYGYIDLGAHDEDELEVVEQAINKQIPHKPDLEGDGYWDGELVYDTGYCPNCHQDYEIEYHTPKYCENCGQALDWSELNGN